MGYIRTLKNRLLMRNKISINKKTQRMRLKNKLNIVKKGGVDSDISDISDISDNSEFISNIYKCFKS